MPHITKSLKRITPLGNVFEDRNVTTDMAPTEFESVFAA